MNSLGRKYANSNEQNLMNMIINDSEAKSRIINRQQRNVLTGNEFSIQFTVNAGLIKLQL